MNARNDPRTLLAQFVDRSGGPEACWLWTGKLNQSGYGATSARFNGRRERGAHRIAYLTWVGPIPDGLQLDHLCRTPRCVNPGHLEPVTMVENLLRGVNPPAVNARKTRCLRGHEFDGIQHRYGRPFRYCKTCNRDRVRRYHREAKVAS